MKERVQVGHNDETADAIPTATEKEAAATYRKQIWNSPAVLQRVVHT